ncbi:reverse transcriptase [Phytophthora megakarya]|uniref:Reverse transcriptase n=1 Tax=Phytophthora megakarya TaxID=4795 RepID=A0A225W3B4_9STRA|nr:reverse transcriptase [Phytophthora megakarya]
MQDANTPRKSWGLFHKPDFSKLRSVRQTIQALFAVLRESGFVLGAFEMERVYDWDLKSWMNAIYAFLDPLTVLVGAVERRTIPIQDRKPKTRPALPPPEYASSEDSDSSVESPKRMSMRQPPRVMHLAATTAEPESTRMQTAPGTTSSAPGYASPTPTSHRDTAEAVPQESTDVAMESAPVSGAPLRLSAFSKLKEFNRKDASEEKARAWVNRLKFASRRDGMTGDEVCALFGDLMAGPARQWYLQLKKSTSTSWTELTDQFRVQYCGKGVSITSRYYHASKHVDETPLEYVYRLNVAGMRAKIHYSDGMPEEKREHVELFINTLGAQEQELASRLSLMKVPDAATLEKKVHARQHSLTHQMKTLFGSNRFRQKAPARTQTPTRAPVGRHMCLRVAYITKKSAVLDAHTTVGWWSSVDSIPRAFGFVRPGSRKYDEWQNLAYEATSGVNDKEIFQESREPVTERRVVSADTTPTREARCPEPGDEPHLEKEQEGGLRPMTGSTDGLNEFGVNFESIPEYEHADEEVIFHEGSDLYAEDVEAEMAVLPKVPLTAEVKIGDLKMGRPEGVDPKEERKWLIGKGNALPPAAKGVICYIDVGNARPVAQHSPWASPIVVIVKKNGVDIRLCADYKLVNGLTQLMVYPMPLVTDLLEDLDKYRWYCSLDIASGFRVVSMTDRARLISAFVTPFGLFEWLRMPFGLCNAPQIYQRLIDNALYGFWKLSPTENTRDVFKDRIPSKPGTRSVLSRRSYIDDILIGGTSWDDLRKNVERLLEVCEEWHLSISVEKSEWGISKVDYLGHEISEDGLGAKPKNLETLVTLEFPCTQKGLQSVLGSLNYYHRFIPDFAIYAAALYSLSAHDFEERVANPETRDLDNWTHAERAFDTLRSMIATTSMLKHFDTDKQPVVIVYASDGAVSAVLAQDQDGVYLPVKFTSRTLNPNKLNYSIAEKEILALLRVLNEYHNMLTGRTIRVLTRHTTLGWLFRSKGLQGRLSQWAAILSPWGLEILRFVKGEEEILGTLAASITPGATSTRRYRKTPV